MRIVLLTYKEIVDLMSETINQQILALLKDNPRGLSIREISEHVEINRNSVSNYLNVLLVSGLVEVRDIGPSRVFYLSHRVPLSAMLNIVNDSVAVINSVGEIILINDTAVEVIGKTREELINKPYITLFSFFSSDTQDQIITKVNAGLIGEESTIELSASWDDEKGFFYVKFIPTVFAYGGQGVIVIAEDITEKKLAEEAVELERDRAQGYLDVASVLMVAIDTQGSITLLNKKGCEILGVDQDDAIGSNWFDTFISENQRDEIKKVFQKLITGEVEPVEHYFNPVLIMDGSERLIEWHNSLLRGQDGQIVGTLSSGSDVTEQVTYRLRLEALHSHAARLAILDSKEDVARSTMDTIRDVLKLEIGSFGFVQDNKIVFTELREDSAILELDLDGDGITVRAVNTGETQRVPDTRLDSGYISGRTGVDEETLSELDVPILGRDGVMALINLESNYVGAFSDDDQRLVETFAQHVASALIRISYDE